MRHPCPQSPRRLLRARRKSGRRRPVTYAAMSGVRWRLGLASMLMLFAELALIRGAASNVVYLSWFTNLVLLASFLGIGLGFLRVRKDANRFARGPLLLMILVGFILLFPAWVGPAQGRTPSLVMLGGIHAL